MEGIFRTVTVWSQTGRQCSDLEEDVSESVYQMIGSTRGPQGWTTR